MNYKDKMLAEDQWLSAKLNLPCFNFRSEVYEDYLDVSVQRQIPDTFFVTLKLPRNPLLSQDNARTSLKCILKMNQYSWNSKGPLPVSEDNAIRPFTDEDLENVLFITKNSFALSRFHRDLRLGPLIGESIKLDWIMNNLTSRSDCINLVFQDGLSRAVLGYVSLLSTESFLVIDLIAVDNRFRRAGIGRRLLSKCRELAVELNRNLLVGTQADNNANFLYLKLNFSLEKQYFVLHDLIN